MLLKFTRRIAQSCKFSPRACWLTRGIGCRWDHFWFAVFVVESQDRTILDESLFVGWGRFSGRAGPDPTSKIQFSPYVRVIETKRPLFSTKTANPFCPNPFCTPPPFQWLCEQLLPTILRSLSLTISFVATVIRSLLLFSNLYCCSQFWTGLRALHCSLYCSLIPKLIRYWKIS